MLLDNGGSAIREDAQFREILHCIRRSACANVCPSFRVVGGHAFGHIYNGPIGLLLAEAHHGLDHAAELQTLCASGNACEAICPAGIPIPSLVLELRRRVIEKKGLPAMERAALKRLAEPASFDRWTGLTRLAQRPFSSGGFIRNVPFARNLTS